MKREIKKRMAVITTAVVMLLSACSSSTEQKNADNSLASNETISAVQENQGVSEGTASAGQEAEGEPQKKVQSNPFEEYADYPANSKEYMLYYVCSGTLDIPDFTQDIAALYHQLANLETEPIYVNKKLWGGSGYSSSDDESSYVYMGELKDGEPDGAGAIYYDVEPDIQIYQPLYEGYFKDGVYDGFGIEYLPEYSLNADFREYTRTTGESIDEDRFEEYVNLYYNPVSFIGYHDKNGRIGQGVEFGWPKDSTWDSNYEALYSKFDAGVTFLNYHILTGEYKKDKLINGKDYFHEYVFYEGEYDDGKRDGDGILYYTYSSAKAFEGTFKKDMIKEGTLYSPEGTTVASGKWEDGKNGRVDFYEVYDQYTQMADMDYRALLREEDYDYFMAVREDYDSYMVEREAEDDFHDDIDQAETILESSYDDLGEADRNADASEYILPYSDSRYLTVDDLAGLDSAQLRLARNEIYARHGRAFQTDDLNEYFNSKSWYYGYISADDFDESVFNEYEKANLDLIKSAENN